MPGEFQLGSWLVKPSFNTVSRNGKSIRLEPKVVEVLVYLAEHPEEVIPKEQLIRAVWGDTFVTDDVLTRCISELRKAFEDDPKEPQVIETIPKRGYRLLQQVEWQEGRGQEHLREWLPISIVVGVLLLAGAIFFVRSGGSLRLLHGTRLTNSKLAIPNGDDLDSPLLTDGSRLYFSHLVEGHLTIQQVSVKGGEPQTIPVSLKDPTLFDISADGTELLVGSTEGHQFEATRLWAVPTSGGPPSRIGDIRADSAGWSPDGTRIVYGKDRQLFVVERNGADPRLIADVACECSVSWPRWSPDGQRVRFTREDYANQTSTLWEVSARGGTPTPLLPAWTSRHNRKGNWTRDGKFFVFDDFENIWVRSEEKGLLSNNGSAPVQLTEGPLTMFSGAISPDGKKIFAVGERNQGEVLRYDAPNKRFQRFLDGVSAEGIDFSRDGQWMVYVAYPEGTLWRSRSDGGERLQLTSLPLKAVLPRWSPDGSRIAFTGQMAGKPVNIYTVNSDGSNLQAVSGNEWRIAPSWSPDGRFLVFTAGVGKRNLMLYDLQTRTSKVLWPGKVFGPSWSPDGRNILAATPGPVRLRLFDLKTAQWRDLKVGSPFPDGCAWSRDGKSIYLDSAAKKGPFIQRLSVADGHRENIVDLGQINRAHGVFGVWFGLDPNDAPMILRDLNSQQIYAFDWEH